MGLKAWGNETLPHRKTEANLKAENSALRLKMFFVLKNAEEGRERSRDSETERRIGSARVPDV